MLNKAGQSRYGAKMYWIAIHATPAKFAISILSDCEENSLPSMKLVLALSIRLRAHTFGFCFSSDIMNSVKLN